MGKFSKAFAEQRRDEIFQSNRPQIVRTTTLKPWQSVQAGAMPPLMFQIRLKSGERISYPYGDIREIRLISAGEIQLGLSGMTKLMIRFEGRHLQEMAEHLGTGLLQWVEEMEERDDEVPEEFSCITSISIEYFTKD